MKGQSLFFEYILLFILSIFLVSYTYGWLESNKDYLLRHFELKDTEEIIKKLDSYFYNAEGFFYFKKRFELENFKIRCLGNYTIFETDIRCKPFYIKQDFTGYYIIFNNQSFFYSNKTNVYYSAIKVGYFVYKSCYESKVSYIFNTTSCNIFCTGRCIIYLEKNRTIIRWLYRS